MLRHLKFISSFIVLTLSLTGISENISYAQELEVKTELHKARPLFRQDTLTVVFMGDMMMHSKQLETAHRGGQEYDFSSYFTFIEDRIKGADLAVANMEFTLGGEPYSGYPCFSAPDSYAYHIAESGFNVFLAANNHILDMGSEGAARTVNTYRMLEKEKGIKFTGIAENEAARKSNYPLLIRRKGITLAFVNFTYGTNLGSTAHWPKTNYMGMKSEILKALNDAEESDVTFVLPHWGPEYQLSHSDAQEETAGWLIDNGADAIIGSHPHVVQDTSFIKGVPVVYSLGNAVSNMSAPNTQLELMVTCRIIRKENGDIEMPSPELTWLWCSRPGGFSDSFVVIPVEDFIGKRDRWQGGWDYDKMMNTYERIIKNH